MEELEGLNNDDEGPAFNESINEEMPESPAQDKSSYKVEKVKVAGRIFVDATPSKKMIHSGVYNSPKIVTQSNKIDTMLEESIANMAIPTVYKLDAAKEYRKQVGANLVRHRELAQESNKRSVNFKLGKDQPMSTSLINDLLLAGDELNEDGT